MYTSSHAFVFSVAVVYQWAFQIRCSVVCLSVDIVWDSGHGQAFIVWKHTHVSKWPVVWLCCPNAPADRLLGLVYHGEEARLGWTGRRWTCHSSSLASVPLSFSSHAERKTTADPVLFQRHVCARNPVRVSVCTRERGRESVLVGADEERQGEGE